MNKEQPPAMEFVQDMEDMAVHGVRRLLVLINYFSSVRSCLSQKNSRKSHLKM